MLPEHVGNVRRVIHSQADADQHVNPRVKIRYTDICEFLQDYCSEKVSDFVQYFIRATTVFIHNLAERRGNAADGDVPVVHEAQGVDDGHRHTEDNLVGCKLKTQRLAASGPFYT